MAFRLNTVQYAWETNTVEQSGSVAYNTPVKRIYIAETGSRTFISADVEMYMRDSNNGTTISNITAYAMSCSIDGNLIGDAATAATITMTGDHATLLIKQTFTDAFNARFTGSNHDVSFRWQTPQATAGPWTGHSFRLIATYQYNDANAGTLTKTVVLPLDSSYTHVPTTQTVFGKTTGGYTNIPALDTFLPESSKQYRDIWIEYTGADSSAAATNVNLVTQIDSGSESTRFVLRGNMATDTAYFDIQNISGTLDTTTAHTLKARSSLANRMSAISPTLYCTYDYTGSSSTIMNSIMVPLNYNFYQPLNGAIWNIMGYGEFVVPEPNPSPLLHSAVVVTRPNASNTPYDEVNGVLIDSSTKQRGSVATSPMAVNVRFDANAKKSADYTITPGSNSIPYRLRYATAAGSIANAYSAFLRLNYSASAFPDISQHSRTLYFGSGSFSGNAGGVISRHTNFPQATGSISGDVTSSFLSQGFIGFYQYNGSATSTQPLVQIFDYTGSLALSASVNQLFSFVGTGTEMGMRNIPYREYVYNYFPDQYQTRAMPKLDFFRRIANTYTATPAGVLRPFWRSVYFSAIQGGYDVTGSLLNCSNAGTNYKVLIYESGSNAESTPLYELTSTGSGATKTFNFRWYERISKLYAVSTNPEIGISNFSTASNGNMLTINFATGSSGGGERSYTWIG